jgi:hypothetical protein
LSIVMTHEASSPAAPVITRSHAKPRLPPTSLSTSRRLLPWPTGTGPVAVIVIWFHRSDSELGPDCASIKNGECPPKPIRQTDETGPCRSSSHGQMNVQTVHDICSGCTPPADGALRRGAAMPPIVMAHPGTTICTIGGGPREDPPPISHRGAPSRYRHSSERTEPNSPGRG